MEVGLGSLLFVEGSLLLLYAVRLRACGPTAVNGRRIFKSKYFTDKVILKQLCNGNYQTKLSEHNWPELMTRGPCYCSLAQSMLQGNSYEQALANQGDQLGKAMFEFLLEKKKICNLRYDHYCRELLEKKSQCKFKRKWKRTEI
mmetsp:Transcript_12020/g.14006  ORF Transcript_12020/g.14006 Transcript_12020/m.14006 type:complete len:144 (+) Transcript_12020:277-708(+)